MLDAHPLGYGVSVLGWPGQPGILKVKAVSEGMGNTWSWLSESHPMGQAEVFIGRAEVHFGPPMMILDGPGKPRQAGSMVTISLSSGPKEVVGLLEMKVTGTLALSWRGAPSLLKGPAVLATVISEGFVVRTEGLLRH